MMMMVMYSWLSSYNLYYGYFCLWITPMILKISPVSALRDHSQNALVLSEEPWIEPRLTVCYASAIPIVLIGHYYESLLLKSSNKNGFYDEQE